MAAIRVMALYGLIAVFLGVVALADALAGEKIKGRTVKNTVKWEQINVGDEDGHVVAVWESKGVRSITEGRGAGDAWLSHEMGLFDMNVKTGLGSGHGYGEMADKDGDKCFYRWEGGYHKDALGGTYWKGKYTFVKGTGKWEGIRGNGVSISRNVAPGWGYTDWEAEVEFPR